MRRDSPDRPANSKEVRLARLHRQISQHTWDGGWICKLRKPRFGGFHEVPSCWTSLCPNRGEICERAKAKNRDTRCRLGAAAAEENRLQSHSSLPYQLPLGNLCLPPASCNNSRNVTHPSTTPFA